jgi:hypothetical protein
MADIEMKADAPGTSKSKGAKKAAKATEKKGKRVNVEIAPAVYRLMETERDSRNGAADQTRAKTTYTDLVNEALDRFLPPLKDTGAPTKGV